MAAELNVAKLSFYVTYNKQELARAFTFWRCLPQLLLGPARVAVEAVEEEARIGPHSSLHAALHSFTHTIFY